GRGAPAGVGRRPAGAPGPGTASPRGPRRPRGLFAGGTGGGTGTAVMLGCPVLTRDRAKSRKRLSALWFGHGFGRVPWRRPEALPRAGTAHPRSPCFLTPGPTVVAHPFQRISPLRLLRGGRRPTARA